MNFAIKRTWTMAVVISLVLGGVLVFAKPGWAEQLSLEQFRKGGYVLMFRHSIAKKGVRPDAVSMLPKEHAKCGQPNRPLSTDGLAKIKEIGRVIKSLGIPISKVISSPWCRTVETAIYGFGHVQADPNLAGIRNAKGEKKKNMVAAMFRLIGKTPAPGTNTVLVSHSSNTKVASKFKLKQAEAAIFKPDGRGGHLVVGRITLAGWKALAK